MKKAKVLKCVFSKKGKILRIVPDTKAKSTYHRPLKLERIIWMHDDCPVMHKTSVEARWCQKRRRNK